MAASSIGNFVACDAPIGPLDLSMPNRRAMESPQETESAKPPKKRLTWRSATSVTPSCSGALDLRVKTPTRKRRKASRTYDFGAKRKKRRSPPLRQNEAESNSQDLVSGRKNTLEKRKKTDVNKQKSGVEKEGCICEDCACQFKDRRHDRNAGTKSRSGVRRQSQRLVIKNLKLPFCGLPRECKLHVFARLAAPERARVARVCPEWQMLVATPGLWAHVDLDSFSMPTSNSNNVLSVPYVCSLYAAYCTRVAGYMRHLVTVGATVESFHFTFDVGHQRDDWLARLLALIRGALFVRLTTLDADWTQTARRPAAAGSATYCCLFNKVRAAFRQQRRRVTAFHKLLETLTVASPNVTHLRLPFDWSPRSTLLLCRWRALQELRLAPYLSLAGVPPNLLETLLRALPSLVTFHLAVCVPLYSSTFTYSISHTRLRHLDISASHGLFIRALDTPQLTTFCTRRTDWRGPLVDDGRRRLVCVHRLLIDGAPNIMTLNRHRLQPGWTQNERYAELDQLLGRVCPCAEHALAPPGEPADNH